MRFRRRTSRFSRRGRRPTSWEMQNISMCRVGLSTGVTSCQTPDQYWQPLVTTGAETGAASVLGVTSFPLDKGVGVRRLSLDYLVGYVPNNGTTAKIGVATVRHAVVLWPVSNTGVPEPVTGNLLFNHDPAVPAQTKLRILWRGQDQIAIADAVDDIVDRLFSIRPGPSHFGSRHVDVKTSAVVDQSHALFWYTEIVQPFATGPFPVFGLDILGVAVVRKNFRGNRYM